MKAEVTNIFDDLDQYKEFCVANGHVFNEAHLYKRNTPWGQMQYAQRTGKRPFNNWIKDGKYRFRNNDNKPTGRDTKSRNYKARPRKDS